MFTFRNSTRYFIRINNFPSFAVILMVSHIVCLDDFGPTIATLCCHFLIFSVLSLDRSICWRIISFRLNLRPSIVYVIYPILIALTSALFMINWHNYRADYIIGEKTLHSFEILNLLITRCTNNFV